MGGKDLLLPKCLPREAIEIHLRFWNDFLCFTYFLLDFPSRRRDKEIGHGSRNGYDDTYPKRNLSHVLK